MVGASGTVPGAIFANEVALPFPRALSARSDT